MTLSKTTLSGCASILGGLTILVTAAIKGPAIAGGSSVDVNTLSAAGAAIVAGIGLIFARDHTTSDEVAGVTPQQLSLKQAVHDAASVPPTVTVQPAVVAVPIKPA